MKSSLQHREEMHEDAPVPLDFKGEIEIEYEHKESKTQVETYVTTEVNVSIPLKTTVSYHIMSIDTEGASCEYKFIGSINYLPCGYEQLIKDYLYQLPKMKGVTIYQIKQVTK